MSELTAEAISRLSPGAAKLYLAYLFKPGATDAQARDITGYKSRWFKKLRDELVEAGLLANEAEELSAEAQRCEAELRSVGVDATAAENLARACPPEMVQSAVAYVRGRRDIANSAGYVVRILREKLKVSRESGPIPRDACPIGVPGYGTPNLSRNEPFRPSLQNSPGAAQNFLLKEPHREDLQKNAGRSEAYSLERRESKPNSNNLASDYSFGCSAQDTDAAPLSLNGAMRDTEFQLLLFVIQATTGTDPLLNPDALDDEYRMFCRGYRAHHVEHVVRNVWPKCWPGNKGELPTLKALMQLIGFARNESSAPSDTNPYLCDPYFADKYEDSPLVLEICPRCGQATCVCTPIPAQIEAAWRSAKGACPL